MTVARTAASYRPRVDRRRSWGWAVTVACGLGAVGGLGLLFAILGTTGELSSLYALAATTVLAFAAVRCAPEGHGPGHWARVGAVTCVGLGVAITVAFAIFAVMLFGF